MKVSRIIVKVGIRKLWTGWGRPRNIIYGTVINCIPKHCDYAVNLFKIVTVRIIEPCCNVASYVIQLLFSRYVAISITVWLYIHTGHFSHGTFVNCNQKVFYCIPLHNVLHRKHCTRPSIGYIWCSWKVDCVHTLWNYIVCKLYNLHTQLQHFSLVLYISDVSAIACPHETAVSYDKYKIYIHTYKHMQAPCKIIN